MTLNSQAVLYNKVGDDENMTPEYAVEPLLEFIPANSTIWCPFDTVDSNFVGVLGMEHSIMYSHLDAGQDFFDYEPEFDYDLIISNPPFKGKRKFFERALELDKPFALLMTLTMFNDKYPAWSFYEAGKTMQLLKFDKRIKYTNPDGRPNDKITFQSGYICCDFLPNDLIMRELQI